MYNTAANNPKHFVDPPGFGPARCWSIDKPNSFEILFQSLANAPQEDVAAGTDFMSKFNQKVTRSTLRDYALTAPTNIKKETTEGPYYKPDQWYGRFLSTIMNRGQIRSDGAVERWEDEFRPSGRSLYFNYALFPTIFSEPSKTKGKPGRAQPLTYAVCYSSFPLSRTAGPNSNEHLAAYPTRYKEIQLAPDIKVDEKASRPITRDMFRNNEGPKVFMDTAIVGGSPNYDESFVQSILAALNNSYCMSGAFITFIPLPADDAEFVSGRLATPSRARLSGPSAGAATFAAVSGYMPWYYTGAMSQVMPFERVAKSYTARQRMRKLMENSEELARTERLMKEHNAYSSFDDTERMQNQWSMAEPIGGLLWKFIYCASGNIPFLFPAQNSMRKSIFQQVLDFAANDPLINYLDINQSVYTMGQAMDGVSILRRFGGQQAAYIMKSTCSGFTMADFRDLSILLLNGQLTLGRMIFGPTKVPAATHDQLDYYGINRKINATTKSYGKRMGEVVAKTRTTKKANKEQYKKWKQEGLSAENIAEKLSAKKKAKKESNKQKRTAGKKRGPQQFQTYKEQVQTEIDRYSTRLLALKISEGYFGMDANEQKAFFRNFPQAKEMERAIKELKHKVPIDLLRAVIDDFLNFHPPSVRKGNGYKLLVARFNKAVATLTAAGMSPDAARETAMKLLGVTTQKLQLWVQKAQERAIANQRASQRPAPMRSSNQPRVEEPEDDDPEELAIFMGIDNMFNEDAAPPVPAQPRQRGTGNVTIEEIIPPTVDELDGKSGPIAMGANAMGSKAMGSRKKAKKAGANAAGKKKSRESF